MSKWRKKTTKTRTKAPKQTAAKKEAPAEPTRVSLQVFIRLCGRKPDQLAGFAWYASKQNLGPLSIPEWQEALRVFDTRPVR